LRQGLLENQGEGGELMARTTWKGKKVTQNKLKNERKDLPRTMAV